jgi:hypothetical protein
VYSGLFFFGQSVNVIQLPLLGANDLGAVVFELHSQCRVYDPLGEVLILSAGII